MFKRASVVPLLWGKGGQVLLERGMECVRVNVWMFVCSLVQCAHSDFRRRTLRALGKSNKIRLVVVYLSCFVHCMRFTDTVHYTDVHMRNCICTKCTSIKVRVENGTRITVLFTQ